MNDMQAGWGRYRQSFRDMCPEARQAMYVVFGCVIAYLACAVFAVAIRDANPTSRPLEIIVALLPGVPLAVGVLAFARFYRFGDELQKRVMADGAMYGLAFTVIAAFPYGALEFVRVLPLPFTIDFWAIPVFGWSIGMSLAWKRHTGSALGIPRES